MNHTKTIQTILNYVNDNIKNEISSNMIAEKAGYSAYHFSRIFTRTIGISMMPYLTWRKLRLTVSLPIKPQVEMLTNKFFGGNAMNPNIIELTPFSAIGYPANLSKCKLK